MQTVRSHNEGSLFQRKSGRNAGTWVAAVTMRSGKRATRWSKSRDEAKADLAELLRLRDAGARETGRVRLGDYLERWVSRDHSLAPSTHRKHEAAIRVHLAPRLGHLRLSELSPADVSGALGDAGREGLHPQSVRHLRATLRRALADALRDGLVTRNVGALSRVPPVPRTERPILDAAQAKLLIDSTRGTRHGPLWAVLLNTGMRISEALGLVWADVTPEYVNVHRALARVDGEWTWRDTKTAKGRRHIPLTDVAREAFRAQRAQQTEDRGTASTGLVFTTDRGNAIHATNLLPKLRADLAAAGLPRVTIHDLRHSCATVLYAQGVPIEAISDWLGHSTTRVTADLYRHRVEAVNRDAAARLQEALG